jgi:hypothetical protein
MVVDNMKNEEDEAFDDMARKQGMWGGGFSAKRAAAVDKLQEPAQEPVAWGFMNDAGAIYDCISPEAHDACEGAYTVPLYTTIKAALAQLAQEPDDLTIAYQSGFYDGRKAALAKRKWVGMTDDEIKKICDCTHGYDADQRIAREVEAKLKEKNA